MDRTHKILYLRKKGLTFLNIGRKLNITTNRAWQIYMKEVIPKIRIKDIEPCERLKLLIADRKNYNWKIDKRYNNITKKIYRLRLKLIHR